MPSEPLTTFVLVHGGCHGPWCWQRLTPLLQARGYGVLAVGLPIETPRLTPLDYARHIADSAAGLKDIILVGHSMAGITIPFVTEILPVRCLVFLTAMLQHGAFRNVPWPDDLPMLRIANADIPVDARGLFKFADPVAAHHFFGPDCATDDLTWALGLLRPQALSGMSAPRTPTMPAGVPITSIIATEDQGVTPDWSRWAARALLDADVHEIPGGHAPFLSRPAALADLLDTIARSTEKGQTP